MDDMLLPEGQVWVGFNAGNISVAASIWKDANKDKGKNATVGACARVVLCAFERGENLLGRHFDDFQKVKDTDK